MHIVYNIINIINIHATSSIKKVYKQVKKKLKIEKEVGMTCQKAYKQG